MECSRRMNEKQLYDVMQECPNTAGKRSIFEEKNIQS